MNTDELARNLLPKNATKLERTAAALLLERVDRMPMLIDTLWTPQGCPVELLPFLAFAVSVDVWEETWPESVKREVIAAAPLVHRKKGTLAAVETALKALGIRAQTQEWWQSVPSARRGTFKVRAFANLHLLPGEPVLSEAIQFQILRQIQAAKPKSRAFELEIGAEFANAVQVTQAASLAQIKQEQFAADRDGAFGSAATLTTGFGVSALQREHMYADRPSGFTAPIAVTQAFGAVQFARFSCIAAP